jgi:hypothetical protein
MIGERQNEIENLTFKGNKFDLVLTAPPKILIKKNLLELKKQRN